VAITGLNDEFPAVFAFASQKCLVSCQHARLFAGRKNHGVWLPDQSIV
jgi:hypothetical protein